MRLRDDLAVIALLAVLAVLWLWLWLGWASSRDEAGMTRVETMTEEISDSSRGFDEPGTYKPTGYNLGPDTGWPADWPSRHEIGLIAWGLHHEQPEVDASSMAIERQADGTVVVTNPPEAPVEVLPEGELEALICSYDWHCGEWIGRIRCESTMNPRAVGSAGERGLTQIHPIHRQRIERLGFTWDDMFDPVANLTVAFDIYREQGARPWSCR